VNQYLPGSRRRNPERIVPGANTIGTDAAHLAEKQAVGLTGSGRHFDIDGFRFNAEFFAQYQRLAGVGALPHFSGGQGCGDAIVSGDGQVGIFKSLDRI